MEKIIKNQSGVTLIEALIAMLVLAVGILAVNAMHISSTRGNVSANKLTIAGATGETIYEALTSQSYSGTVFDAGKHQRTDRICSARLCEHGNLACHPMVQFRRCGQRRGRHPR